jgi:GTP-binding protein EngB required for normal cell division
MHHASVTYKTEEEITNYLSEIDLLIKNPPKEVSGLTLENEKKAYVEHLDEIRALVGSSGGQSFDFKFDTLDELKSSIQKYITDPVLARAVKSIEISTKNLNLASGNKEFVLYDVPGYDSPLKFHKDQTQKRLSEADLIIFIHSISERADLKEGQVVMMTISDNINNKSIKTKEKLFVFLNKADKVSTSKDLDEKLRIAKRDWEQYCRIDSNLFIGSAHAYLYEKNVVEGNAENIEQLSKLGLNNGIEDIKNAINKYLENERFTLITNAINLLFRKSNATVQELLGVLERNGFKSEFESMFGDKETLDMFEEVTLWWDKEKGKIEDEFEKWYFDNILKKEIADDLAFEEHPKIVNIKSEHLTKIDSLNWNVERSKIERQILRDMSQEVPQINTSNINVRKDHYEICMRQVDETSHTLSTNLRSVAKDVIFWIFQRLYGIEPVNDYFYKTFNLESYAPSMSALYIRHARPLVDVFIKAPHGIDDRKNIANARKAEINSLKISLEINLSFDLLKSISQIFDFLGLLNFDKKTDESGFSIPFEIKSNLSSEIQSIDFLDNSANNEIDLIEELNTDTKLLVELLKGTAFEASGIMEYCYQELDKIRRFFKIRLHEPQLLNLIIKHSDQIPELYNLREKVRRANHKKQVVSDLINKLTTS